jgi:hypothetical protein
MYNSGKGLALIEQVQFDRVDVYTNYYLQVIFIYKISFPIHCITFKPAIKLQRSKLVRFLTLVSENVGQRWEQLALTNTLAY